MNIYKLNINKAIDKLEIPKNYGVYGGITKDTIEDRLQQHIYDNQPRQINSEWIIFNDKPITTINIKHNTNHNLVSQIEEYLIEQLNHKFGIQCINDRNQNGSIAHRGGAGEHDIQLGDQYKLYILYGPVIRYF